MKIVSNMGNLTEKFLPCDLTSFDAVFPIVQDDPVLLTILAIVKEPKPIEVAATFVGTKKISVHARDRSYYSELLRDMCKNIDGVETKAVWKNLNQQGQQRNKRQQRHRFRLGGVRGLRGQSRGQLRRSTAGRYACPRSMGPSRQRDCHGDP